MAMNKSTKRKWVEALRSGEYKQGRGALSNLTGVLTKSPYTVYCCLGVLRDIGGGKKKPRREFLTEKSCGLTQNTQSDLAQFNDDGKSFDFIANVIEESDW